MNTTTGKTGLAGLGNVTVASGPAPDAKKLSELGNVAAIEALRTGTPIADEDGRIVTFRMARPSGAEEKGYFEPFTRNRVMDMIKVLGLKEIKEPLYLGCGLYFAQVVMTPARAQRLLQLADEEKSFNLGNRHLRVAHADQFTRTLDDGAYWQTHQFACFGLHQDGSDGPIVVRLRDSQHRLRGCADSTTAMVLGIVFGVAQDAIRAIDAGIARSLRDRARFAELEQADVQNQLAALKAAILGPGVGLWKTPHGQILRYCDGDTVKRDYRLKVDVDEMEKFITVKEHKQAFAWAFAKWENPVYEPGTIRDTTGKGVRVKRLERGTVIAAAAALYGVRPKGKGSGTALSEYLEQVNKFVDLLLYREGAEDTVTANQVSVVLKLQEKLLKGGDDLLPGEKVFLYMTRAFDFFAKNDAPQQLKPFEAKTGEKIADLAYKPFPIEALMPAAATTATTS